jgi:hypothetical protein
VQVGIALIEGYSFTRDPASLGFAGLAATVRRIEDLGFDRILTALNLPTDFPLATPEDEKCAREIVATLQACSRERGHESSTGGAA